MTLFSTRDVVRYVVGGLTLTLCLVAQAEVNPAACTQPAASPSPACPAPACDAIVPSSPAAAATPPATADTPGILGPAPHPALAVSHEADHAPTQLAMGPDKKDAEKKDKPEPAGNPEVARLTPEQIDAALEVLREQNPELSDRIDEARKDNPERVNQMLTQAWPKLKSLIDLYKKDQELFKHTVADIRLTRECDERALKVTGEADAHKQEQLRKQLQDKLSERFDTRQKIRERELALFIANYERRAKRFRDDINDRQKKKNELVEDELRKLIKQ